MKYYRFSKGMYRFISVLLLICFVISFAPANISFAKSQSTEDKPVLIYVDKDFETQNIGEIPYGFYHDGGINAEYFKVVNVPTADNPDNKAANFMGHTDTSIFTRQIMYYTPADRDFVVSMNFSVSDTKNEKSMALICNITNHTDSVYLQKGTNWRFLTISDKISVGSKEVFTGVEADTWYKMELLFKLDSDKVVVYINDKECGEYNIGYNVNTVDAVRFNCASVEGSDWYIDNYRSYVSDIVLSDEEYAADLAKYEASSLRPPERYETGRTWRLNPYAFHTLYGEFVMSIGGMRFWKHDRFYTLPSPLEVVDGKIIVPLRIFSESFGADVQWSPEGILVTYNGTTLRFIEHSDAYYVNGKPSKMYHPVIIEGGVSYVQLDVLTNLFGVKYKRIGELISFTGDIECAFSYTPQNSDLVGEIMTKIQSLLVLRYPSSEDIVDAFNAAYPTNSHPRLLFTDWDEVRANMEKEEAYKKGVEKIINLANSYIDLDPVVYEMPDGLRGEFPQQILDRGRNLSFAYKVTGDVKYKNRIWEEIDAIYNNFPDFNPGHQLDTGNSIHGMAYIYDWLYDDWNEDELAKIEEIFERIIYPHFDAGYMSAQPFLYGGPKKGYANFTIGVANQTVVINAGMLAAAVACFDKNPQKFGDVIATILHAVTGPIMQYAPDGGWQEGGSYWVYTVNSLPVLINNLITGVGTDFDICKTPGLMETSNWPISLSGANGSFKAGDDSGVGKTHGYHMFAARQSDNMALAKFYKENVGNYDIISLANFVFDSEIEAVGAEMEIPTDYYFAKLNHVTMKAGQDDADTMVYFHGGSQQDSHGHMDTGTFLFDMLGERWTAEITHENYNLREYGSYENDGTYIDNIYRGRFYRDRGEAKNVVITNYDSVPGDLATEGKAEIEKYVTTEAGAYAIMNLTTNNPIYECGVRGIMLNRATGQIIVEDDYQAKEDADFWWFMSTDAEVEISSDGKSAILSKNNKRIWASILTDGDNKFEFLAAKPLSVLYPDTYAAAVATTPPLQTEVTAAECTGRLAIHNPSTDRFNVSVAFAPLIEGENEPSSIPEYKPMASWKLGNDITRGTLSSVVVDGEPLSGFKPNKYSYTINVLTEKSDIPKISVAASDEYDVEVKETQTVPGITTAVLKRQGTVVGIYNFAVTPLNDTTTFLNDKQLPVQSYWATSEPQPENPVTNLFDNDLGTKYATDEYNGEVTIDYGSVQTISEVQMAFTNGAKRTENFMIEYSEDGVTWNIARDKGTNSGTTNKREIYDMNDVNARYIRLTFYGNNAGSAWVSVAEFSAFTK